jgi:hypothetical protein
MLSKAMAQRCDNSICSGVILTRTETIGYRRPFAQVLFDQTYFLRDGANEISMA